MAASFKAILLAGLATASVWAMPATAGPAGFSATAAIELAQPSVELIASRKGPKVKGYLERRGGYSYSQADSINTYGDARSTYGSSSSFRDPSFGKQSISGPFDHGFFFDSAIGPRGGDAPYQN